MQAFIDESLNNVLPKFRQCGKYFQDFTPLFYTSLLKILNKIFKITQKRLRQYKKNVLPIMLFLLKQMNAKSMLNPLFVDSSSSQRIQSSLAESTGLQRDRNLQNLSQLNSSTVQNQNMQRISHLLLLGVLWEIFHTSSAFLMEDCSLLELIMAGLV